MIYLNLKDGLGNQLFEYAYARWLQEQYGDDVSFNLYFFKNPKRRSYSLNHFVLNENIKILDKNEQKIATFKFLFNLALSLKFKFINWFFLNKYPKGIKTFSKLSSKGLYVSFEPFAVYPFVKSKRKNKFIYGNFESDKYFPEMEEILQKELTFKTAPSIENKKLMNELRSCNSVCLHIRRGDYLDETWKSLQVCNYEYYNSAVEEMKKLVPNSIFYVFSNTSEDIAWIKENYIFDADVRYVDLNNPDYEELRLMSCCKHFILSNSSFSWWGSYLSPSKDKIIFAPEKWTLDDVNEGIYRKSFIKIRINKTT